MDVINQAQTHVVVVNKKVDVTTHVVLLLWMIAQVSMFVSFFIIYMTCIYIYYYITVQYTCCIFSFLTIFLNQLYYKVHVVGEPNATVMAHATGMPKILDVDVVNRVQMDMDVVVARYVFTQKEPTS